jgi:hypothetical protein
MGSLILFFALFHLHAQEPGHLVNENLIETPPPQTFLEQNHMANLTKEFNRAKGLTDLDARGLQYNRVSCERKIYSPSGWTLEGDADLKVVEAVTGLYEMEFPSHLFLRDFNPYQNGYVTIETVPSRQLINLKQWKNGQSLKLFKTVRLTKGRDEDDAGTAYVSDEFKVIAETYPATFIVKETIFTSQKFSLYFFCR